MRGPRPALVTAIVLAAPIAALVGPGAAVRAAHAQPDWLPPEVKERRARAEARPQGPCADPLLQPLAPPVRDSGLDQPATPCLRRELSVRARGTALPGAAGQDDTLLGSLLIDLRLRPLPRLELTIGARAIDHPISQDAAVGESETAIGPLSLGVAAELDRRTLAGRPLHLGWALRFDVPYTDSSTDDVPVAAASPQLTAAWAASRRLVGHARLAALLWLARPPDDVRTRRAAALSTDWVFAPARVIAIGIGAEAQTGWYEAGLDHLLVRGGLRVPLGCEARLELSGAAPILGEERADLLVLLGLTRDL